MDFSDQPTHDDHPALVGPADDQLSRIYTAEFGRLAALGRALTGDDVAGEDLAHEVFVDVIQRWRRQPGFLREPAWPYLRTAVRHLASRRRRRLLRELLAFARADIRPAVDTEAQTAGSLDLLGALAQLPPRMRACVILVYCEDVAAVDAAAALGISPRTVETQLRAARLRLATLLDGPGRHAATNRPTLATLPRVVCDRPHTPPETGRAA